MGSVKTVQNGFKSDVKLMRMKPMADKEQIIIDGCNISNCKYYMENNGVEYHGLYQYTNMCYKQPYDNCENKPFCWYKLVTRIKRIFKYGR